MKLGKITVFYAVVLNTSLIYVESSKVEILQDVMTISLTCEVSLISKDIKSEIPSHIFLLF